MMLLAFGRVQFIQCLHQCIGIACEQCDARAQAGHLLRRGIADTLCTPADHGVQPVQSNVHGAKVGFIGVQREDWWIVGG